jgi:ribosomal protein L40E
MIETPGTTLLSISVAFIVVSVIVGALNHLIAAIALFAVGVTLIYFAVQLRKHESPATAKETEVREREIVKVKCKYCGALNPDGARNCGSCGAVL